MSRNVKHTVPLLSDAVICRFMEEACRILGADQYTFLLGAAPQSMTVSVDQKPEVLNEVLSHNGNLIQNAQFSIDRFTISYHQGADEASVGFATLEIRNDQASHPPLANPYGVEKIIEIDALVSRTFLSPSISSPFIYRDPKVFRELMNSHQRMLEQMQKTIASVGEETAAARRKLEEEYWGKNSKLLKDYDKKRDQLEAETAAHKRRLEEEESLLQSRLKSLDDRNNTHARRALHTNLKARIAEHASKFELTKDTNDRRRPVHIAVWVAMAGLLLLLLYTTYNSTIFLGASTSVTVSVIAALKPLGLTVALLGLLSWYIRWMNRWFERHADAEFQLKQFELDIDRASWVVETSLEWRFEQNNSIPDHLLESISRNLFTKGEKDEGADAHPADYLASALLGRASGLRLKVPGGEIEYGKGGIKGLQKDTIEASAS
ncbi:MAG: hypothetical protein CTR54_07895 [Rhizobium sp.]|nr:MAG: hypothetical protein CTR54_07895 [Rhizobium sp.]